MINQFQATLQCFRWTHFQTVSYGWVAWRSQLSFQMVPSVFPSHTFPWLFYSSLHSFYISVPPSSFFPSYMAFSSPLFLLTLSAAATAQADPNIFCVSPPGMCSLRPKSWEGRTWRTGASQYGHLLVIIPALVGLDASNRRPDPQCPWSKKHIYNVFNNLHQLALIESVTQYLCNNFMYQITWQKTPS